MTKAVRDDDQPDVDQEFRTVDTLVQPGEFPILNSSETFSDAVIGPRINTRSSRHKDDLRRLTL